MHSTHGMVMRCIHVLMVICIVLLAPVAGAQAPLRSVWQQQELGESIGGAGLWCGDLDADGTDEVVLSSNGFQNRMFTVLHRIGSEYAPRWTSRWYGGASILRLSVLDTDRDGDFEIYVVLSDGYVEVYDGATLELVRTHNVSFGSGYDFELADVDGDGALELVVTNTNSVQVYELETGVVEDETSAYGGKDAVAGDVDADGDAEIVLNTGHVLDADSLSSQWSYFGSFGDQVQLGNIDGDGALEVVSMSDWDYVSAFDAQERTPLWQIETNADHDAFLVENVTGSSAAEILLGNGQWGAVRCFDAATRQELWSIMNPEHGVTNLAVGDPDSDGVTEVIWGAGQTDTGPDRLHVASVASHQVEWSSVDVDGPFVAAAEDLNGDGIAEIVGGAARGNSGYENGRIFVYDGVTHVLNWTFAPSVYGWVACVAAAAPTPDRAGRVIYGTGNTVRAVNADTHQEIWASAGLSGTIQVLQIQDIDDDGVVEIVVGDATGRLYVFNGDTFAEEWRSIDTGTAVEGIVLENVDADPALEIVFFGLNSIAQIYDGKRHTLQWQSTNLSDVTALCVGDHNLDGTKDLIAGHSNGRLSVLECGTFTIVDTLAVSNQTIRSLAFANLDDVRGLELLVGDSRLQVVDITSHHSSWQSDNLRSDVGRYGSLVPIDIEGDRHLDVVTASSWGLFEFTAPGVYLDITPPAVRAAFPAPGLTFVGRDTPIRAVLSEPLDLTTVTLDNVTVTADSSVVIAGNLSFDSIHRELSFTPDSLIAADATIRVTLRGALADSAGNGLDGNGNGIGEGSPEDDFAWTFRTGMGTDDVGPEVFGAGAQADTLWAGIRLRISATISDSSTIATSGVLRGEMFLDSVGLEGSGTPLLPVDGAFDSVSELVGVAVATDDWSRGTHTVYLRGQDVRGNWGAAVSFTVVILRPDAADWTMYGGDPRHSGVNSASQVPRTLELDWSATVGTGSVNQVCAAGGLVYAVTPSYFGTSKIVALREADGTTAWSRDLIGAFSVNPPSFAYGHVYYQSCNHAGDTWLWCVDALTGEFEWRSPFAAQWESYLAPTVADGKVFIDGGSYGGMYCFDAFGGAQLWFKALDQYDQWTPAYHDGVVYAFVGGTLTAADAETGGTLWTKAQIPFNWGGWSMRTAPVVDAAHGVLLTTSNNYLHAISLSTQEILWSKTGTLGVTPAVHDGKVYAIRNNSLEVYDVTTGQDLWTDATNPYNQPPVIANGMVFLAGDRNTLALDLATHALASSYGAGGKMCVSGDKVYIGTDAGRVLSLQGVMTPVFLESFEAVESEDGVQLAWRVRDESAGTRYRVVGRCGDETWEVPSAGDDNGAYRATDSPHACSTAVAYTLYYSPGGSEWAALATREVASVMPRVLTMGRNLPNPFHARTTIRYGIPQSSQVRLVVYGVRGNLVAVLVDERQPAGYRVATWNGRDRNGRPVAAGVYFARLETRTGVRIQRMVLAK